MKRIYNSLLSAVLLSANLAVAEESGHVPDPSSLPIPPDPHAPLSEKDVVDRINSFSFRYFSELNSQADRKVNVLTSGFGVVRLLTLASLLYSDDPKKVEEAEKQKKMIAGAILGQSPDQLKSQDIAMLYQQLPKMVSELNMDDGDKKLLLGAALFSTQIDDAGAKRLSKILGTEVIRNSSMATINTWAAQKTNNLIKDLVSRDSDPAVVSTVYFKQRWQKTFDPANIAEKPFATTQGPVNVSTLNGVFEGLRYVDNPNNFYRVLSMPFEKGKATDGQTRQIFADFYFPDSTTGMSQVMEHLRNGKWSEQLKDATPTKVDVSIPALDLSTESISPDTALANLGVKGVRVKDTSMEMKEKGVIKMTPEGAEVALASALTSKGISLGPVKFHVNAPYVVVFRDDKGRVLASTVVNNPKP